MGDALCTSMLSLASQECCSVVPFPFPRNDMEKPKMENILNIKIYKFEICQKFLCEKSFRDVPFLSKAKWSKINPCKMAGHLDWWGIMRNGPSQQPNAPHHHREQCLPFPRTAIRNRIMSFPLIFQLDFSSGNLFLLFINKYYSFSDKL